MLMHHGTKLGQSQQHFGVEGGQCHRKGLHSADDCGLKVQDVVIPVHLAKLHSIKRVQ